jgi:putative ABC transport system permease protein
MSLWRQFIRGLRVLSNRAAPDQDLTDEVQQYLEQSTAAHVERGLSPEDARRAALLELGNVTSVKEQMRAYGWENVLGTFFADLRYAARQLHAAPGFTAVTVLTLALGIGATTAIFSAVNPILFESLPYPQAQQIMAIWDFADDGSRLHITFGTYREVLERSRSFDALAVTKQWQPTLTSAAHPERLDGQRVSASYFRALAVSPVLGRDFDESDDQSSSARVAILGGGLWRRLGGDSAILGRQIKLDDQLYTVIGVMANSFENVLAPSAELWTPLQYDKALPPQSREWGHHLRMVGRLRPGVGIDQAKRELNTIARTPVLEFPRPSHASLASGLLVNSLQADVTGGVRPALLAILGAVLLVLVIACVNVINLLLARGVHRRGEFALRAALGAARPRLVRQMLTESLLLAVLGGALGMMVAQFGVQALVALNPTELPRVRAIRIDGTIFVFALGVTAIIGMVVGLIPALHASRGDLHLATQQSSRRTAGGHQLTRHILVASEVALALVLLVSAGLLLRSLQHLFAIDPGFDGSHLLTMQVQTFGDRFDDDGVCHEFFAQALQAVERVPGVAAAAFTSQLPLSGEPEDAYGVHSASSPAGNAEADNGALRYTVDWRYFETMAIPLRRGRLLNGHDAADTSFAVVISESLARSRFAGQEPIGQRLRIGPSDGPWYTIVGVAGNVKQTSLAMSQSDAVYITPRQWKLFADKARWLVVRVRGDTAALAPDIRAAIWSIDKDQPIVRVATMDNLLAASAAQRRFALLLFEAFALTALLLAAAGIYGMLSESVAERTREIGIRSALGASPERILALIIRQGLMLTGLGIAIGLAGAAAASQLIDAMLFGISRLDPVTYLGVTLLLLVVSVFACWVPAGRAASVDPAITLRSQ